MLPGEYLLRYRKNPELFISEVLDDNPRWSKQIEIINSVRDNRNTYVKSCHGVGKTFISKDVILWFLYCFYPSKVITTAPSWAQVEKLLWSEINYSFSNSKVSLGGSCLKTSINISPEWFAIGVSPKIETEDDGKRLTGFHSENLLVVFDEAPAVNEKLWEIKETLMTSENVKFLGIGNPVEDNGSFFEGFRDGDYSKISMDIFESPNFTANSIRSVEDLEEIANLEMQKREELFSRMRNPFPYLTTPRWAVERLQKWGKNSPMFMSRVLAQFPSKSKDTIISFSDLERCSVERSLQKSPKCLGVDVARFGDEFTCVFGIENFSQVYKEKWNGQDTVRTSNIIKNKIIVDKYRVIVIDDTGVGGGVTDQVMDFIIEKNIEKDVLLLPVNFGQASTDEDYYDIVTQMYFKVKDFVENEEVYLIDSDDLFSQLSSRKYSFTRNGKFKIESKDDYKKRTGKSSPDEADACILCMWGLYNRNINFEILEGERRLTDEMDW